MAVSRTTFYLDKDNKKIAGVCAGIADYTGVNVKAVRIATVVLALASHGAVALGYLALLWFAPDKPHGLYPDREDAQFWQGVRSNPKRSSAQVRSKLRDIDRRLADVETLYTSNNSRLASEIDSLR